ncbi:type IV secretion system DNA-binding domain-containing protein [Candidatus Uhrbacteria bacterium]|nr:type IV secretion system DNA-binding domain-containing protein [Candidatus Uhrbacteria bacterium]
MLVFLLQIAVVLESPEAAGFAGDGLVLASLILAGLIFAVLIFLRGLRYYFRRRNESALGFDKVVLRILVPKEALKAEEQTQSPSIDKIRQDIGVSEALFSAVGGLRPQKGFKAWLAGRSDAFSFEIVSKDGLIYFYLAAPKSLRDFLEQQVHAQFPSAQIEEVRDYNIFNPTGVIAGANLIFKRPGGFPIKTYKKLDSDPLSAITNSMSKIASPDGAAIQFVVRSARGDWRSSGLKIARAMQQGKSMKEAMRGASFLGGLQAATAPAKKEGTAPPKEYKLSPLEEEAVRGLEEKASKAGLEVNVRIIVSSPDGARAKMHLDNIANSFSQFNIYEYGNSFSRKTPRSLPRFVHNFIYRTFDEKRKIILNAEEFAGVYHFPLPGIETPNIMWLSARKPPPPTNLPKEGMVIGTVKYRGQEHLVRIKQPDRLRHFYIIGKSGVGKSEFLKQMIKQDIEAGRGICALDPHGDLARDAIALVPKERVDDVIYFDPSDIERPMGLNMLEYDERYPEQKTFVINEILKIFDKLYDLKATGGPMFEQYMRNALLLIMDDPESGSTLMEVPRVLADEKFRAFKLSKCKTQVVKDFWLKEAQKAGGEASLANMVPYITSKLTPFITNDIVRPIIGQQKSAFNFRQVMDEGKILLLDLSKGKLGELNAYLIGMVVVGKILAAALSRTDMPREERQDFFLYIDEFQNFLTDSIATILSEARKYGLGLVIAHQYIGQLVGKGGDTAIRDAIFGNVGTMAAFRVGAEDAEFLSKEFAPVFGPYDLINCDAFTANTKLLIDNTASRPFNVSIPPPIKGDVKLIEAIKNISRLKYGRNRKLVEAEILERAQSGA